MKESVLTARSSSMDPAGPSAAAVAELTWWMVWGFGAFFLLVMALLAWGVFSKKKEGGPPLGDKWFILGWGVILPTVVLSFFLVYSLVLTARLKADEGAFTIKVTGHMWWWNVEYPQNDIVIANEIYIPVGKPVRVELHSNDVIHSLWIPSIAGKMDLIPGKVNVMTLEASEAGVFRGQCAEYCGLQHAKMHLFLIALQEEDYQRWLIQRKTSRLAANTNSPGGQVFRSAGCYQCHRIGNEGGLIGPDLTHMGSRLSVGSGTLPNNFGNLAGWISNPQTIKPGNLMPRSYLSPDDLHTLTQFLLDKK